MKINWSTTIKCPRCYSLSVFVGVDHIICLLCNYKKKRIGRR